MGGSGETEMRRGEYEGQLAPRREKHIAGAGFEPATRHYEEWDAPARMAFPREHPVGWTATDRDSTGGVVQTRGATGSRVLREVPSSGFRAVGDTLISIRHMRHISGYTVPSGTLRVTAWCDGGALDPSHGIRVAPAPAS